MASQKKGLVSIIMPSYNSARTIAASIESIQRQTYTDWELLITDDSSTDSTLQIASRYAALDPRIRLFTLSGNKGAGIARNKSIQEAEGQYIAFCDSDDMWLPTKLERQLSFMQREGYAFTFASYFICNRDGNVTGRVIAPHRVSLRDTKRDDKIGFLTAIYDAERLGKFFMPDLRKRQDWAYVLEILKKCHMAYALPEPLAIYRKGRGSISHNKFTLIRYNARVYEVVFGYSRPHAYAYLFLLFLPSYFMKRLRYKLYDLTHRHDASEALCQTAAPYESNGVAEEA